MLERLIEIDKSVLLFFNGGHSAYLDKVMWIYSGKLIWLPCFWAYISPEIYCSDHC